MDLGGHIVQFLPAETKPLISRRIRAQDARRQHAVAVQWVPGREIAVRVPTSAANRVQSNQNAREVCTFPCHPTCRRPCC